MKIIGIGIDGIVRDKFTQFDKMYRKKFIKNEQIVKMDEYFRYVPEEEEEEGEITRLQNIINELIKYPIDTYDLKNHYKFSSKDEYENFLNADYVFEIYGSAPQVPKSMDKINKMQKLGEANKAYEIVLFSNEQDQAVQATFHFLAKAACRINKIMFEKNIQRIWDYCDIVITDNPEIIESKPIDKISIKIKREYNQFDISTYEFENIFEIEDSFLINTCKKK